MFDLTMRPVRQPSFTWEGPPSGPSSRMEGDGEVFAPPDPDQVWAEKLVGPNNLRPIAFLEKGIAISRAVAHLTVPGVGAGTGFLIGRDLLLTNNHVIGSPAAAEQTIVRFNYQDDLQGNELAVHVTSCLPRSGFHTSPYSDDGVLPGFFDYTVVRLKEPAGDVFGTISMWDIDVAPPADVVIIQHPAGQKKQIAIADNEVVMADELKCQYLTDTLPGSSGSPVFNDKWELVALHHAGGFYIQPGDPQGHLRNEGVRIRTILADVPEWVTRQIAGV